MLWQIRVRDFTIPLEMESGPQVLPLERRLRHKLYVEGKWIEKLRESGIDI